MKKLVVVIVLAMFFSACGGNGGLPTSPSEELIPPPTTKYSFQVTVAIGLNDATPSNNTNAQGYFYIDGGSSTYYWFSEASPEQKTFSKEFTLGEHSFKFKLVSTSATSQTILDKLKVCFYYALVPISSEVEAEPAMFGSLLAGKPYWAGEGAIHMKVGESHTFKFIVKKKSGSYGFKF